MFKRNIIPIFIILIILAFLMQPKTVSEGAFIGLNIWVNNIIPYLFPMSILSNILLQYNFMYSLLERFSFISKIIFKSKFAFIPYFISFISGYPSGGLVTNILFENKRISKREANYLLIFTNNCSFQFIAGAVAFSMLGNFNLYMYIAFPHFLGAIILSSLYKNHEIVLPTNKKLEYKQIPFNEVFSSSIYKSVISILSVGGVIVIFSIFSQFLTNILSSFEGFMSLGTNIRDLIFAIIVGILEITNGCSIISSSILPLEVKLIIINFLISFSGISVTFQTIAITSEFNFNIKKYLKGKFIFGIISAFICTLMLIII